MLQRCNIALLTYVVDADPTLMRRQAELDGYLGYALDVELEERGVHSGEKVIAFGCRNLEGDDLSAWNAQMVSTALQCPRSKHPFEHIVLSWQTGEIPTNEQMAEAVTLLAKELGCEKNQIVWAAHGNTDNIHVHIVINRIDPETFKAVQLGDGWDKDRLAQIRALIEARQGWCSEAKAPYLATDQGEIISLKIGKTVRTENGIQTRKKGDRAADLNAWREKPENLAIIEVLLQATSWQSLHEGLSKLDAIFVKKITGASIIVRNEEFKASQFGRDCSMKALTSRLDEFEKPLVRSGAQQEYERHKATLAELRAELRAAEDAALAKLKQKWIASAADTQLQAILENERLALEAVREKAATTARQAIRKEFRVCSDQIRAALVTESEWLRGRRPGIPKYSLPTILFPDSVYSRFHDPLPGYQSQKVNGGTQYRRQADGVPTFTDYQICIVVHVITDADIVAALRLAASRWEIVDVSGSKMFQQQCARLAAEHGIQVSGRHISQPSLVEVATETPPARVDVVLPSASAKAPTTEVISSTSIRSYRPSESDNAPSLPAKLGLKWRREENVQSVECSSKQHLVDDTERMEKLKEKGSQTSRNSTIATSVFDLSAKADQARLAFIHDLFHQTSWSRSDYPESLSNSATKSLISERFGEKPQHAIELQGKTNQPTSDAQERAARAAFAASGMSR